MRENKTILLTGGLRPSSYPARIARGMGLRVVACGRTPLLNRDWLVDRYCRIDDRDGDALYELARNEGVDGIACFGGDALAKSSAYAADLLGLPGGSNAASVARAQETLEAQGGHGRRKVTGVAFSVDGQLVFRSYADLLMARSFPHRSISLAAGFPSSVDGDTERLMDVALKEELEAFGQKTQGFSFEFVINEEGVAYCETMRPFFSGLTARTIQYATGVDLAFYAIKAALGEDCSALEMAGSIKCCSYYLVAPEKLGRFRSAWIDGCLAQRHLVDYESFQVFGDAIGAFEDEADAVASAVLKFDSCDEMTRVASRVGECFSVAIDDEREGQLL